jgi:hypothetical protein
MLTGKVASMPQFASSADMQLKLRIATDAFAFVQGDAMRTLLLRAGALDDWPVFVASWNDLALDEYMADHGSYRRRRHALFSFESCSGITRQPHQAHYQSRDYNAMNGGIPRWFEPIMEPITDGASLLTILRFCTNFFGDIDPDVQRWQIEVHQFRIEANVGKSGFPTPEGVHRDGVDYVLVLLVARQNILSGTTTIHGEDRNILGSFTLSAACDAALLDDHRVYHGVTAVQALDSREAAYRDVLVVTLRRA